MPAALPPAASFPDDAVLVAATLETTVVAGGATDDVAASDTTADEAEDTTAEEPDVAPVAAIRASRSDWVVHVILVPAELTRGSEAQLHSWTINT